jgi:putative hemolysin
MQSDTLTFDLAHEPPEVDFTYSHSGQSLFRRSLIRTVEALSGQLTLRRLYVEWAINDKRPGEVVFDAALRKLNIRPSILSGEENLSSVPTNGGLLIVANHPFGVVDGLTLGHLGMRLRGNVHILTNSLLCRVPEVDPHLLPVDFSGTSEARRLTAETRRHAAGLLAEGFLPAVLPRRTVRCAAGQSIHPGIPSSGVWPPCRGPRSCRFTSRARTRACSRLPATPPIPFE